jgi:hypothetical protein
VEIRVFSQIAHSFAQKTILWNVGIGKIQQKQRGDGDTRKSQFPSSVWARTAANQTKNEIRQIKG